jgi:geranylgeranyl diphosphate synthase type II
VGSDLAREKSTYPSLLGIDESKRLAEKLSQEAVELLRAFDNKAEPLREIARYVTHRKS